MCVFFWTVCMKDLFLQICHIFLRLYSLIFTALFVHLWHPHIFFFSFLKSDLRSMLDVFETKTIDRNGHEVSNRNKNTWTKKKQRLDHSDQNKPRRDNSYIFIYFFSFFLFLFLLPCFYFIHLMSFTSIPTIQLLRWIINFFPFGSAYVSIKKKLYFWKYYVIYEVDHHTKCVAIFLWLSSL